MKLILNKHAFSVAFGKFLGYMVNQRGIAINPNKIQVVLNMQPPSIMKEVQYLIGRLAALSCFILKAMDRHLSFLKILKSAKKFEWTK